MEPFDIDFKTGRPGLEKVLGPLESEIMGLVWSRDKVTVREIHKELCLTSSKNIAYTTVMTTMTRLAKKGLLSTIKEGNAYLYEATHNKEEFLQRVVHQVIDGLLVDFLEPAVAHFIDKISDVDPGKLKQLEDLISNRKKPK